LSVSRLYLKLLAWPGLLSMSRWQRGCFRARSSLARTRSKGGHRRPDSRQIRRRNRGACHRTGRSAPAAFHRKHRMADVFSAYNHWIQWI